MAMIIHRCTACGHREFDHTRTSCSLHSCRCNTVQRGPSHVVPTVDKHGREVARVIAPGDGLRSRSGSVVLPTCGCDECRALYADVTA